MEKEKKVGENNKVKKVVTEKKENEERVVFDKHTKLYTRVIAIILAFLASAASIFMFVFGIIVSLKILNLESLDMLTDNFSVTFISNLHGCSIGETRELLATYGDKTAYVIFHIVIPIIAFVVAMVLLVLLAKLVLDFVDRINNESQLYTKQNIFELEKIACYMMSIMTITLIIFNTPSILMYAIVSILVFVSLYLFEKVVRLRK